MIKKESFFKKHPFFWWMFRQYIVFFVGTYMLYYSVYYILYSQQMINWERFSSLVFELIPYTNFLFIGILIISRTIDKSILTLTKSIKRVANGDFSTRISIQQSTPFQDVAHDFDRMVNELSQVQTLRDDFINQFSHEFKTPVTSIQGFAQLLRNDSLSSEQKALYLDTITKEARRLEQLANNVMVLTALEGQEIVIEKEEFDLTEQIRQATISAYPILEQKNIQLELDLAPLTYFGNPQLLMHVWNNLLSNALKFTEVHGHIGIKAWRENQGIKVSFTNDGPLIPAEQLSRLFDKFYQEDKTGIREGLGLGLSIVKRALLLSNGSIEIDSNPTIKTRYTVTLDTKKE